jgi:signal transduction histidine kinase
MDDAQATAVFRIVQESLTNVLRHADAERVDVVLNCCEHGMELTVRDDGRGFNLATVGGESFGLLNIRERATILGGEATVESEPGEGTRVSIRIPLSA